MQVLDDKGREFRDLRSTDGASLARLHCEAFQSFFLTSFGEEFLARFYRSLLIRPWGFGVGLMEGDCCRAFAVGSVRAQGVYQDLARTHGVSMLSAAIPVLIRNPGYILSIARSLGTGAYSAEPGDALLCSISVSPTLQRAGVGGLVLEEFERRARSRGCDSVVLTTDADANEYVNIFYLSKGYLLVSTSATRKGRRMNCYRKLLLGNPA